MSAVAEVDAADERDVVIGPRRAAHDDELLVMAAPASHTFVEEDLAARPR